MGLYSARREAATTARYDHFQPEEALRRHQVIAEKLRIAPKKVRARALRNLKRMRKHCTSENSRFLDRWLLLLHCSPNHLIEVMTSVTQEGHDLRRYSPFDGVLTKAELLAVSAAAQTRWTVSPPDEPAEPNDA